MVGVEGSSGRHPLTSTKNPTNPPNKVKPAEPAPRIEGFPRPWPMAWQGMMIDANRSRLFSVSCIKTGFQASKSVSYRVEILETKVNLDKLPPAYLSYASHTSAFFPPSALCSARHTLVHRA